jgi:hypothetical protein
MVETERIPDTEIVTDRTAVETETYLEVQLQSLGKPPTATPIDYLSRWLMNVVTNVFHEHIWCRSEFTFQRESRVQRSGSEPSR